MRRERKGKAAPGGGYCSAAQGTSTCRMGLPQLYQKPNLLFREYFIDTVHYLKPPHWRQIFAKFIFALKILGPRRQSWCVKPG